MVAPVASRWPNGPQVVRAGVAGTLSATTSPAAATSATRIASGEASFSFGDLFRNDEFNRQRLGLIAMVAIYVATITWVGATIGLFFLLIGCMWLLGVRNTRQLVGVALTSAVLVHLALITLLGSKLPRGLILNQLWPTEVVEEPAAKAGKKR